MKKIVITETQLKRLTKSLVTEQQITLGGLSVSLDLKDWDEEKKLAKERPSNNPNFGTVIFSNQGKNPVRVRLYTSMGDTNIVKLVPKDGGVYIETLKGKTKQLGKDVVDKLIQFVNTPNIKVTKEPLISSMGIGLYAKKV